VRRITGASDGLLRTSTDQLGCARSVAAIDVVGHLLPKYSGQEGLGVVNGHPRGAAGYLKTAA